MGFILDFGGDTVFRKTADTSERLSQVLWLKDTYRATVIVLTANKMALKQRFIKSKNRSEGEFDQIWLDWENISQPYWGQCGDIFVDTSSSLAIDIIEKIESLLDTEIFRNAM
jgi:hypothetical protein